MKILMVMISHDKLGDTGKKTGFRVEQDDDNIADLMRNFLRGAVREGVPRRPRRMRTGERRHAGTANFFEYKGTNGVPSTGL